MNMDEILHLIEKVSTSNITNLDLTIGNDHISISKNNIEHAQNKGTLELNNNKSQSIIPTDTHKKEMEIRSPMVGVVYLQEKPEKPVYKKVGDSVKKGDVVCLIEAMKTVTEIKSKISGTIEKVLVSNEEIVEYNQPLFSVRQE